jgi:16S rRNA (adenine1518-N6/adenine1519-N6)-dimethyltransferase
MQLPAFAVRPKKSLGQHFLVDPIHRARIVAAADLISGDLVLEIGSGRGELTELLAAQAGRVVAVELDDRLVPLLRERFASQSHVKVVHGDILEMDIGDLMRVAGRRAAGAGDLSADASDLTPHAPRAAPYKVVANLPYYITSPVLRHFLEASVKPELMVVMVQKEVAEAIAAGPGRRSMLSISVQFYGRPAIVARLPAAAFYPRPEIDSAVVKIEVYSRPPVDVDDVDGFFRLVRAGFTAARKQAANSLAQGLGLPKDTVAAMLAKAGIAPQRRAETFTLEEWSALYRAFGEAGE